MANHGRKEAEGLYEGNVPENVGSHMVRGQTAGSEGAVGLAESWQTRSIVTQRGADVVLSNSNSIGFHAVVMI